MFWKNEWEESEIKVVRKELENHESVSVSLEGFLDSTMSGNPFDKKKQLETYRKLVESADGNRGREIHEYIKRQS